MEEESFITRGDWRDKHNSVTNSLSRGAGADREEEDKEEEEFIQNTGGGVDS